MQLPKNYFKNLSAARYREYLKLLPDVHQETSHMFIMLALTFGALTICGIFAINPTLSTIFNLKKQLADDTYVNQALQTKIDNLSSLEQQYNIMGPTLTNIYNAIPLNPQAPLLSAQLAAVAKKNNLTIIDYRVAQVELATETSDTGIKSFVFTLEAQGTYTNMVAFTQELANLNRLITVESMEIGRDQKNELDLTIRGREYFKQQ